MKAIPLKTSIFAASIGVVGLFSACSGSSQGQMQQQAPQIAVVTVEPSNSELQTTYPAIIKGKTDIDIRPQVTGFITKVHVDEGDYVHQGQVLFTLDQVQYQAAVDQAQAAVNSARVAVENAQIQADNQKRLYEKNIISESQYTTTANQLAQAKAQLAQAQAQLESAKKNLSYTVVTSPSNGIVGSIPNREGSLASPSSAQALTTVSENKQMYAYFSLNEKDLLKLTNNGQYSLESQLEKLPRVKLQLANGTVYPIEGKIATVSGVINNTTGAASVRALFDNENGVLRSGSTGQIIIPEITEEAIVIPQKASFELQDRRFVYVVNDSNKVTTVPITVLAANDGKNFVVTSGLNPGDRVVTEGVGTKVKDGMTITPIEAGAQAAQ
ncbi:MAG: efflux RND transporter periplasmic adaptor subunit [Bacteroidales bacterium]|nr:efflux RND transporter periplasmic adaptor subunit [Bacteroidales bacterium]